MTSVRGIHKDEAMPDVTVKLHDDFHRIVGDVCGDATITGWVDFPEAFSIHFGDIVVTVTRRALCVPCAYENCED